MPMTDAIGVQPAGAVFTVPPLVATQATRTSPATVRFGVLMVSVLVAVALAVLVAPWRTMPAGGGGEAGAVLNDHVFAAVRPLPARSCAPVPTVAV